MPDTWRLVGRHSCALIRFVYVCVCVDITTCVWCTGIHQVSSKKKLKKKTLEKFSTIVLSSSLVHRPPSIGLLLFYDFYFSVYGNFRCVFLIEQIFIVAHNNFPFPLVRANERRADDETTTRHGPTSTAPNGIRFYSDEKVFAAHKCAITLIENIHFAHHFTPFHGIVYSFSVIAFFISQHDLDWR